MTLRQVMEQILTLIEEYDKENDTDLTNDPDIAAKIKHSIDNIQVELSQIKRIRKRITFDTTTTNVMKIPTDLFKIDKVKECDFEVVGNDIVFDEKYKGIVNVYYDKYPQLIENDTDLDTKLELSRDALEALVYGVASAILKADISANYSVYEYKYQELKQQLNNANTNGFAWIE